jgi:phage terminase Nu1 subunit (DNA packaging protein)
MATTKQLATLYGRSERTVSRWKSEGLPIDDPVAMSDMIAGKRSRFGISKLRAKEAVVAPRQAEERSEVLDEYLKATSALIRAHFAMVQLAWDDPSLRERLKPVFDITRPYVEEP